MVIHRVDNMINLMKVCILSPSFDSHICSIPVHRRGFDLLQRKSDVFRR